jgi:hypothetical protein
MSGENEDGFFPVGVGVWGGGAVVGEEDFVVDEEVGRVEEDGGLREVFSGFGRDEVLVGGGMDVKDSHRLKGE